MTDLYRLHTILPARAWSAVVPRLRAHRIAASLLVVLLGVWPAVAHAQQGLPDPVLRRGAITLNLNLQPGMAYDTMQTTTMDVTLFPDVTVSLLQESLLVPDASTVIWHGSVAGADTSDVTLVSHDGALTGNVRFDGEHYQIRTAEDGSYIVEQLDPAAFPAGLEPVKTAVSRAAGDAAALGPQTDVEFDDGGTLDVMVLYTTAARVAAGGTAAIQGVITLAMAETNTGMGNSLVTPRVQLVHMQEISYVEGSGETAFTTTLSRLRTVGDGFIDEAHTLRDTYAADLVALLIHDSGGFACGLGYLMTTPSNAFKTNAFTVTQWSCATGNYSFGHELGHNWGAHHDRANAGGSGSYSYSYGYQQLAVPQRTIMAYNSGCGCPRLNYWSNPDVSVNGFPMGIINTDPSSADNRLTINNNALIIANWRLAVGPPPPATGVTLSPDLPSGQTAGASVTWGAQGQGGSGSYEYEFSLQGPATGNVMTVQQAYGINPTWVWNTTGDVGSNTIRVRVRNAGTIVTEDASTTAAFNVVSGPVQSVTLAPSVASPQENGTAVTWTAVPTGGGPVEFEFWQNGPATGYAWIVKQNFSTTDTYAWDTTGEVGTNAFHVRARNQGSSAAWEAYTTVLNYSITLPVGAATGVVITPSPTSPQADGVPVTITATGQGGSGSYEYEFSLQGPQTGNVMTVQQAYATTATWAWDTTGATGDNTIRVRVRNAGTMVVEDASNTLAYTIAVAGGPPTSVSLMPSLVSPQDAGTAVTWSAAAAGGSGPYEYQFWQSGPSTGYAWAIVRAFSATATYAWDTTGQAGTNAFHVRARNQGSTALWEIYATVLNYSVTLPAGAATGVTLTPNLASPQIDGTTVIFTAAGQGGSGNYEYQFSLQGPQNGNVLTVQAAYSTTATWTWFTTGASGTSTVLVRVRNAGSMVAEDANTSVVYTIASASSPPTSVTLTPSAASPQDAGTAVTWTAAAAGGSGAYEYQFWQSGPSTGYAWTIVRGFSATATYAWDTSGQVGTNAFHVRARAQGSSALWETYATVLNYQVVLPAGAATGVTLTPSVASPQIDGTTVIWTAAGQGGSGNYEYQFSLQGPQTGNVLQVQQGYVATATWTWFATSAEGANTIVVRVRNAGSMAAEDASTSIAYTINSASTPATGVSMTPDAASATVSAGTVVTWTAVGQGGSGSYEYEFWLAGPATGNAWTPIQLFSAADTFAWDTTGQAGISAVHVRVRAAGSTAAWESYFTYLNYVVN